MNSVFPVTLPNDQELGIIISPDGKLMSVHQIMPPKVNWLRMDMPTRHEERLAREEEWMVLRSLAFSEENK